MTEPAPKFTEEDREVLAALADNYDAVPNMHDGRLIARAAAYVEELEARLIRRLHIDPKENP